MAEQVETVQTPEKSKIHAEEDCRLAARGLYSTGLNEAWNVM